MYKIIILITLFFTSVFSSNIMPTTKYISSGSVVEIIINEGKLYSATDAGVVDIFNIKSKKITNQILVPKIKDFMGEEVDSKIFSIDILNKNLLILSQAAKGYRNLFININGKNINLINESNKMTIAKAKFLNESTILLAMLSNELVSYDIKSKQENWRMQASGAKFSDFVLNEEKTEVVVADESGDLKICNTRDGKITNILEGQNLDNVFQVDYKNGIIITAGQDRRAVVYAVKFNSAYYKKSNFLIYSAGLSPSGKLAGYASDENNSITIFDTITQKVIGVYSGNKMTLTNIVFNGEKEFFSASDGKTINLYKIK